MFTVLADRRRHHERLLFQTPGVCAQNGMSSWVFPRGTLGSLVFIWCCCDAISGIDWWWWWCCYHAYFYHYYHYYC